tara:strand:+ start:153 stop:353 length:201 start_codon:yes stop_codon:yes gene_type:complete
MADIPAAIWEGSFKVFGVEVRCCVLDNGERVINADDMAALFEARGGLVDEDDLQPFLDWTRKIATN